MIVKRFQEPARPADRHKFIFLRISSVSAFEDVSERALPK